MKLNMWAKKQGISYRTAWRWFKAGTLPQGITMTQMPTGTIIVNEAVETTGAGQKVALYGRIPSSDHKNELDAQLGRLAMFAGTNGWTVVRVVVDVGPDEGNLPELSKLLADPLITGIVVEQQRGERILNGLAYVESALAAQGRKLIIANSPEGKGKTRGRKSND